MSANVGLLTKFVAITVFAGIFISGCSDKEESEHGKDAAKAEINAATESKPKQIAPVAPAAPSLADQGVTVLPVPSSPANDGDYYKINRGMDLLYLYGTNVVGGLDIATAITKIYATTDDLGDQKLAGLIEQYTNGDEFAKRDTAKQIEPILKENISKAASIKYLTVDIQGPINLGEYDFDKQGFAVNNSLGNKPEEDGAVPFHRDALSYSDVLGYKLSFINASDFNLFKIPEDVARKVNEYRKSAGVGFRIYGYIQSVAEDKDDSYHQKYVVMKITKVELISSIYNDGPQKVFASVEL